jgi:hypothetical protein
MTREKMSSVFLNKFKFSFFVLEKLYKNILYAYKLILEPEWYLKNILPKKSFYALLFQIQNIKL